MPELFSDLTQEHVERFVMLYNRRVEPCTANTRLTVLRSFFKWLSRYGYVNMVEHMLGVPAATKEQRVLSRQEYELVIHKTNGYMRDCFIFLCNTGLRAAEFVSLPSSGSVSGGFVRVCGKRRKNRVIPCNKSVMEILSRDPQLSFIHGRTRSWLAWACVRLAQQAGVESFHPHSCRHYFATECFRRGMPISTISRLLGHASSAVTEMVYVHWRESELIGVLDILD